MRRYRKSKDKDFRLKLDIYAMGDDSSEFGLPSPEEFADQLCKRDSVGDFFPSDYPRSMIHFGKLEPSQSINPNVQSSDDAYETFSVLSYNFHTSVKDDNSSTMRNNCPQWATEWKFRGQNLLLEIKNYNADIICLQEVPRDELTNFFELEMKDDYAGSVLYKEETSREVDKDGNPSGGCVTCYRRSLFQRIERRSEGFEGSLALVVKLKVLRDGGTSTHGAHQQPVICVVNTGFYSKANDPNKQSHQVLPLVFKIESSVPPEIPLLICGDLNFGPASDAHKVLLRNAELPDSQSHPKPISVLESAYASLLEAEGIKLQQLSKMDHQNREPKFTKFTSEFYGTVDYILYRVNTLKVVGLLELLDKESLPGRLFSLEWSSDHIALMATFKLILPKSPPKLCYRDVLLKGTEVPVKRRGVPVKRRYK